MEKEAQRQTFIETEKPASTTLMKEIREVIKRAVGDGAYFCVVAYMRRFVLVASVRNTPRRELERCAGRCNWVLGEAVLGRENSSDM